MGVRLCVCVCVRAGGFADLKQSYQGPDMWTAPARRALVSRGQRFRRIDQLRRGGENTNGVSTIPLRERGGYISMPALRSRRTFLYPYRASSISANLPNIGDLSPVACWRFLPLESGEIATYRGCNYVSPPGIPGGRSYQTTSLSRTPVRIESAPHCP